MKGRVMVKWNWRKSRIIFPRENEHLVYLFIFLFIKQITLWWQKLISIKARNLKIGQMRRLYMNLRSCNFGGATSRGLGQMHPKLVTSKFIK